MPRKGPAQRREIVPDPIYKSVLVTQFVNKVLQRGKRSTAERIMYNALDIVQDKGGQGFWDPGSPGRQCPVCFERLAEKPTSCWGATPVRW